MDFIRLKASKKGQQAHTAKYIEYIFGNEWIPLTKIKALINSILKNMKHVVQFYFDGQLQLCSRPLRME